MAGAKRTYNPIKIEGRLIAKSWWGLAWCRNLELYADYVNRIGRGKSYVRSGKVLDLDIKNGKVEAVVQGSRSRPYHIAITISEIESRNMDKIKSVCQNKIGSLTELASGSFPHELAELFTQRNCGLFPSPHEIKFSCSCPDWASMCKHVAAVLYGIGARLDDDPTMFFKLRNIDVSEFIRKSIDEKVDSMLAHAGKKSARTIKDMDIKKLFGTDIEV